MTTVGRLKDGNLLLKGEINERTPLITSGLIAHFPFDGTTQGLTSQFVVRTKIYPEDGQIPYAGIEDENGAFIYRYGRDWHISVWDKRTGKWATGINFNGASSVSGAHACYDVYGVGAAQQTAFVNTINGLDSNYIVIIAGSHAPEYYNVAMVTAIKKCGGTTGNLSWTTRKSYICVGVVGCGEGKAITEVLDNRVGISTNVCAEAEVFLGNDVSTVNDCTLTKDGVVIEEATTNFYLNVPPGLVGLGSGSNEDSTLTELSPIPNSKTWKMTKLGTANLWNGWEATYGGIFNAAIGESWTISGWYKTIKSAGVANLGIGNFYTSDWSRPYNTTVTSSDTRIIADGKWHFFWCTILINEVMTNAIVVDGPSWGYSTAAGVLYINGLQWEKKAFPTSFVNGSRGVGRLDIPFSLKPPYTIRLKHESRKPLALIADQGSSPMIFQMGDYYGNASVSFWNYNKSLTVYMKGNTSGGWTSSGWYYGYTDATWNNTEHEYVLVAINNTTFKIYMDGAYLGEQVNTEAVTNITYISMGNAYQPNATYRDFSMYNRALSDEEINKLYRSTFSIKPNGDMLAMIIEKPNNIPSGAYYFPLGADAKDIYKNAAPSSELNTAYEDGSVWVGTTTANILSLPSADFNAWGGMTGTSVLFSSPNGTQGVHLNMLTSGGINWYNTGGVKTVSAATTYTVSAFVKYNKTPSANLLYLRQYRTDSTQISEGGLFIPSYITDLGNGWKRAYMTFTTDVECTQLVIQGYEYSANMDVWIYGIQCEQRKYYTPYANGTRGATDLEYNLYNSIGLDWSGNWTIIYWKKPIGTDDNTLTGYSIESIGSNSNSVGGGYAWWGKTSGVNALELSSPSAINPATYFGKWQMISLQKSGSVITIINWDIDEQKYVRTIAVSTAAPNYYVTPYGYDLKLGGWDSTGTCNSYFKDLIVVKSALSVVELEVIHSTQARTCKDGEFQLQGKLIEGFAL